MKAQDIAEILDPRKERAEWWARLCPKGHRTTLEKRAYPRFCFMCGCNYQNEECPEKDYIGPDFPADDLACFRDVLPRLLSANYHIVHYHDEVSVRDENGDNICDAPTYAAALCVALAWLAANAPEALSKEPTS